MLALFALPVLAAATAVGGTQLLVRNLPPAQSPHALSDMLGFGIVVTLWLGAAIASTSAASLVTVRSRIGENLFRLALTWAVPVTAAMAVVTAAAVAWGIGPHRYAPDLYAGNGGVLRTSLAASWIRIVVMMGLFTVMATWAVIRGYRRGPAPA